MGKLTKGQHELLRAIQKLQDTDFPATIGRMHWKHTDNMTEFRNMRLVTVESVSGIIRITDAGRAALQEPR